MTISHDAKCAKASVGMKLGLAAVMVLTMAAGPASVADEGEADTCDVGDEHEVINEQYWFQGTTEDQLNKFDSARGSATFSRAEPSGETVNQFGALWSTYPLSMDEFLAPNTIYWAGDFAGRMCGELSFTWHMWGPHTAGVATGVDVRIWADPDWETMEATLIAEDPPTTLISTGPTPGVWRLSIPVEDVTVEREIVVQVLPYLWPWTFMYNSAEYPSGFTVPRVVPVGDGGSEAG